MIAIEFSSTHVEGLDGRDTTGRTLYIQIGPLLFHAGFSWGRKK